MSQFVDFAIVRQRIIEHGQRATVVTVSATGAPHVVSAIVEVGADEQLFISVGTHTRENLISRPRLSLVWQPPVGGEYQLVLDGHADSINAPTDRGSSRVALSVDKGILHRLAELPGTGPTCIPLH